MHAKQALFFGSHSGEKGLLKSVFYKIIKKIGKRASFLLLYAAKSIKIMGLKVTHKGEEH